jgi:hypothetical protein
MTTLNRRAVVTGAAALVPCGLVPGGLARERQLLHPVKRRVDYKPSILDGQRNCPTIRRRTGDFA